MKTIKTLKQIGKPLKISASMKIFCCALCVQTANSEI